MLSLTFAKSLMTLSGTSGSSPGARNVIETGLPFLIASILACWSMSWIPTAASFVLLSIMYLLMDGADTAARMPMTHMTIINSIRVNPLFLFFIFFLPVSCFEISGKKCLNCYVSFRVPTQYSLIIKNVVNHSIEYFYLSKKLTTLTKQSKIYAINKLFIKNNFVFLHGRENKRDTSVKNCEAVFTNVNNYKKI